MAILNLNSQAAKPSALNVSRVAQVLRSLNKQEFTMVAEAIERFQAEISRIGKALATAPSLKHLTIESADITNLSVGGENDPGIFEIFSGPPSYTRIGFDGTEATTTTATISTVSGNTVNFSADHPFGIGDIINITGCSSLNHLGYWVVDDVPTGTSIELDAPPTGSGTGGTATLQTAGGWRRVFAIGEDGFSTAPFFTNQLGKVFIGKNGAISILDTLGQVKAFIGVVEGDPQTITAFADNGSGLFRMTLVGHGYETGDDVVVEGLGDFAITRIDDDTFDLDDSTFGAYTLGSVYRYRGPFWGQSVALGNTGYEDATFRTYRNGALRIGDPEGARLEYNPVTGELTLTDAALTIVSVAEDAEISINAEDGVRVKKTSTGNYAEMRDGVIAVRSASALASQFIADKDNISLVNPGDEEFSVSLDPTDGVLLQMYDNNGVLVVEIKGSNSAATGYGRFQQLKIGSTTVIDNSRNASFNSLALVTPISLAEGGTGGTDAATARTSLDVYSKAQVDALLAGKANTSHIHTTIAITGTSGGGVASHLHTGQVS